LSERHRLPHSAHAEPEPDCLGDGPTGRKYFTINQIREEWEMVYGVIALDIALVAALIFAAAKIVQVFM
jgi:hypothetical protein